jgi:hypothetical protein
VRPSPTPNYSLGQAFPRRANPLWPAATGYDPAEPPV